MKKLILLFAAIVITAGAYAQTESTNKKMSQHDMSNKPYHEMPDKSVDKSLPDGVMLQNGIMMKVEDGQMTVLDEKMTMSNGTKIMNDGTYVKKDGTKKTMEEGQLLDMEGKIITLKKNKDNNTYFVPDSTKKTDY